MANYCQEKNHARLYLLRITSQDRKNTIDPCRIQRRQYQRCLFRAFIFLSLLPHAAKDFHIMKFRDTMT